MVKDQNGAVVPSATVAATHTGSKLKVERITDESGQFLFPSLAASVTGFAQLTKTGIDLRIGQTINVDLELEAGSISVTETVTMSEQFLQSTTGEVSDVIERRRVAERPLNGRQFIQLALLSEGVVKPPGGTRGGALQQAGDLVIVAGQRSGHNIYLVDGVKVTDDYFNNSSSILRLTPFRSSRFRKRVTPLSLAARPRRSSTSPRHGTISRQRLRVSPQREARRGKLLRRPDKADPAVQTKQVWRQAWWSNRHPENLRPPGPRVFLPEL